MSGLTGRGLSVLPRHSGGETTNRDTRQVQSLPFGVERLKRLLAEMGIPCIFAFNEFQGQPEGEMDLAFLAAEYRVGESDGTPPDFEGLIHVSHEDSLAVFTAGRESFPTAWKAAT